MGSSLYDCMLSWYSAGRVIQRTLVRIQLFPLLIISQSVFLCSFTFNVEFQLDIEGSKSQLMTEENLVVAFSNNEWSVLLSECSYTMAKCCTRSIFLLSQFIYVFIICGALFVKGTIQHRLVISFIISVSLEQTKYEDPQVAAKKP